MGKLLVFLCDDMAAFEMSLASYLVGHHSQHQVVGIGYNKTPMRDLSGILYTPVLTVAEALPVADIEGLIIPGGASVDLRSELASLIHRLDREQRLLAAICAGPIFLALAGVLNGRRYTTSLGQWNEYARKHYCEQDPFPRETFTNERMVSDGHILTAIGYAASEFGVEIASRFGVFASPEEKSEYLSAVRGPEPGGTAIGGR